MASLQPKNNLYGFTSPLSNQSMPPIISLRVPAVNDFAPLGAIWIDKPANNAYILTSIVSNLATWILVGPAGGAIVGTSLTINPGPISFTGSFTQLGTVNMNVSGASVTNIGTGTNTGGVNIGNNTALQGVSIVYGTGGLNVNGSATANADLFSSVVGGTVAIGGTAQTGILTIGRSTASNVVEIAGGINTGAQFVDIANGASAANSTVYILNTTATSGTRTLSISDTGVTSPLNFNLATGNAAHVINIGNATNVNCDVNINAGTTAGIALNAGGNVNIVAATNTAAAYTAALSARVGYVILTGQVLAAGAVQDLVINNTFVAANTPVLVTVQNQGANDAQLNIQRITTAANTLTVKVKNDGAQALNGNIVVTFAVLG